MKKVLLYIFVTELCIFTVWFALKFENHTRYKNYIIEHVDDIQQGKDSNYYRIDSCEYSYFEDITIRMNSDSSYFVIFWADRDSWLWDIKKDDHFSIDIPYNRYKGKNVDKDIQIIDILNNINNLVPVVKDSTDNIKPYTWMDGWYK